MSKALSILGFITSAKDFLCNRLFAWAELSFGENTFKLLITPVVHLLLALWRVPWRRRLLEWLEWLHALRTRLAPLRSTCLPA